MRSITTRACSKSWMRRSTRIFRFAGCRRSSAPRGRRGERREGNGTTSPPRGSKSSNLASAAVALAGHFGAAARVAKTFGRVRASLRASIHAAFDALDILEKLPAFAECTTICTKPTRISSRRVAKPGIASWQRQTASLRSLPEPGQKRHDLWRLVIISRACRP